MNVYSQSGLWGTYFGEQRKVHSSSIIHDYWPIAIIITILKCSLHLQAMECPLENQIVMFCVPLVKHALHAIGNH